MKTIGITGGLGCGKTIFTNYLKTKGFNVVDSDEIAKQLFNTPQVETEIANVFLTLDRKVIREMIFESPIMRKKLEDILQPKIITKIKNEIDKHQNNKTSLLFVCLLFLFERNLTFLFDQTVTVVCDAETQIERIHQRDNVDKDLVRQLIQMQNAKNELLQKSDTVIYNNGSMEDFQQSIDIFLAKI